MINKPQENIFHNRLMFAWLLSLLCIPMLSLYGRFLQLNTMEHFSLDILKLWLGLIVSSMVIAFFIALIKSGVSNYAYHLIWVGTLSVLMYTSLPFVEKIHVALFGMFGLLSQKLFEQKIAAFFAIAVSGLDESLQHFLVVRVGDWRDVWLNLFSASLGMFLAFLLFESSREHAEKSSAKQ
jgi:VanZ like family